MQRAVVVTGGFHLCLEVTKKASSSVLSVCTFYLIRVEITVKGKKARTEMCTAGVFSKDWLFSNFQNV